MKFSQIQQRVGNRFKQRIVPIVNGIYGAYSKLAAVFGNPITISNASDKPLQGLRIFGKSTQDGTPTPTTPVDIISVVNPTVKVDSQTLTIPYTLHGIPVTSGGNYTDTNGQQWICDEVDFERGVYVQRVNLIELTGSEIWRKSGSQSSTVGCLRYDLADSQRIGTNSQNVLCTHYPDNGLNYKFGLSAWMNIDDLFQLRLMTSHQTVSELQEYLSTQHTNGNPVIVYYSFIVPIEKPLTADQIAAYKALHTNEPNTTISNNQNAEMVVTYIKN